MGWLRERREIRAEEAALEADLKAWADSGYGRAEPDYWVAWSAPEQGAEAQESDA
jgi:hypothetical protein